MKIINKNKFSDKLPDAILFDADNTFYPYDPAYSCRSSNEKVTRRFSISEEDFNKAYEDSRKRIKKVRLNSIIT